MAKVAVSATRSAARHNRRSLVIVRTSGSFDTNRAFLEVGLKRDRVGGVQRHLVDELAFIEPWHEYDTARHAVATARLQPGADEAAARLYLHLVAATQIERGGVVRMHEADGIGKCAIQLWNASGHRAGVPVLEHTAGHKPIRVAGGGRFGRRLVGQCEDASFAVGEPVELHALPRLYVGVKPFAVAPARLLAIHDRPAKPARLVIGVEGREIVTVSPAELSVFLK